MRLHVDADFRSLTKQISMCQLFSRKVTCRKVYVLSLIDNGLDDVSWRFFLFGGGVGSDGVKFGESMVMLEISTYTLWL